MEVRKGVLRKFGGSWGSGLGYLLIEDSESGVRESIPCDNAPTVRALEACFGNVISDGHTVNNEDGGFIGQEVFWSYDEMGLMLKGFTPVDEAPDEIISQYEEGR